MIQCPSNRCPKPAGPFSPRGTLPLAHQWFEIWWCDADKLFFIAPEGFGQDDVIHDRFRGFPDLGLNWIAAAPEMTRWGLGEYLIELTHSWRDVEITLFWMDNRGLKQRLSMEWSDYNATESDLLPALQAKGDLRGAAPTLATALAYLLQKPADNRLHPRR